MDQRLNKILLHPLYQDYYRKIEENEHDRLFCKHNMTHFLDVARISYIIALETDPVAAMSLRERIYAAALLHDIGRHEEYSLGIPHERASASLCLPILTDAGFLEDEIHEIQKAIVNHRNPNYRDENSLSGYIYRGDKASRPCHSCRHEHLCNWDQSKKNLSLKY
jgi:uncharacterized protein